MEGLRLRDIAVMAAAFMLGAVTAFFLVGPALFADGGLRERLVVLSFVVCVLLAFGALIGVFAPTAWKAAAIILVLPVLPVVVLFGGAVSEDIRMLLLAAGFVVGGLAASLFGAWVGVSFSRAIRSSSS